MNVLVDYWELIQLTCPAFLEAEASKSFSFRASLWLKIFDVLKERRSSPPGRVGDEAETLVDRIIEDMLEVCH